MERAGSKTCFLRPPLHRVAERRRSAIGLAHVIDQEREVLGWHPVNDGLQMGMNRNPQSCSGLLRLRLAGDLDDRDAHLKREPEKKAG
jgi:hypothetical protein